MNRTSTLRETYRTQERFVELFQEVFGPAAAAKLVPEYGYLDIEGRSRFIDFALESLVERYAIEIDGESFHHPAVLSHEDYADQLVRQNSLVHQGWHVLRWTDWQLGKEPDRVQQHLSLLLDTAVRLVVPQDHLPCKRGALIDLFEHQEQALDALQTLRKEGNQIALLPHAVGTGKTTTAIEDARRMGLRTLFLAHTLELIDQALARFAELWPEAACVRLGDAGDETATIVVGTVQSMLNGLSRFTSEHFGYLIIDEAHHATSRSYQSVLRYFDPQFLLGLTGTPGRADGLNALEVFRTTAHRMDLETAVRSGLLCDVRCFRVVTNVDLRNLRFNGTVYRQTDLEQKITVSSRNDLIVDTYRRNVEGRRAVVFCVNVAHAEEVAQRFRAVGVSALAVSGQLPKSQRQEALDGYRSGEVRVLCACDVLNEGWDAPETEVLLMARPTLSKVIYQQQLGRGMRKHPGKECLILFDFVDIFSRHNVALSLNRLLRKPQYRAGSRMFHPEDDDSTYPVDLPIHLWASDYEQIDIFDWQERVEGMVTAAALSRMLRKSESWVKSRWQKGEIKADEVVELGGRNRIPYFAADRVQALIVQFGLCAVTDEEMFNDLIRFLQEMDMTASYKPVWFKILLDRLDKEGRAAVAEATSEFHRYYLVRSEGKEPIERPQVKMSHPEALSASQVQAVINQGPFDRFSRLDFVGYARDKAYYEINRHIWQHLKKPENLVHALRLCDSGIESYYESLARSVPHK